MSERYPGGYITKSPPAATSSAAPGVWTLDQALQNIKAGTWPLPPLGDLYVWGANTNSGTLGYGLVTTAVNRSSPVQVAIAKPVSDFDGGNSHAMIITDGALWGWGAGANGRLGDGTTTSKSSPVQIGTLTNWSQVSTGTAQTASIKSDGTLWTWGLNTLGILGLGDTTDRSSPTQVGTLTNWAYVWMTSGNKTHAIKTDGTLWSWGSNGAGQLGIGNTSDRSSPVQVGTMTNWAKVGGGTAFGAAIKTDGTLWAWGDNTYYQLGNGTTTSTSSPIQVGTLSNWAAISAGASSLAAINTSGQLWGVGSNNSAQMGLGGNETLAATTQVLSPTQIGYVEWNKFANLGSSNQTFGGIFTDGSLFLWGSNDNGQLGDGTTVTRRYPGQVGTLTNWSNVAAGSGFVTAVTTGNALYAWGRNGVGMLGLGDTTPGLPPLKLVLLQIGQAYQTGKIVGLQLKQTGQYGLGDITDMGN